MDIDLDLNSASSQHSMSTSDVNLHRIKRLCIRENTYGSDTSSEIQAEGYASEEPTSVASVYINSESSNYFQMHGQDWAQTNERPPSSDIAPPFRKRNLKRPHSSLSIDATAGSANTFFSSIHSEEMAVAINEQGFIQQSSPPVTGENYAFQNFERLSTVSADDIERAKNELQNHGNGGCDRQFQLQSGENREESDQQDNHRYESFNSMLGTLHVERERRIREMRMRKQSNPLPEMNVNSGSVSSLTSFSTAAGTETDGKNGRGNRWKIPKQVHLQSHSNLS
jgi:hypothetical protein